MMAILEGLVILSTLFTNLLLVLPSRYEAKETATQPPKDCKNAASGAPAESSNRSADSSKPKTSVQVVVLGDIGRSPRMQYHAISIAKHGGHVNLIGYRESDIHLDVQSNASISVVPLHPVPRLFNGWPFVLAAPLKVLWQMCDLYFALAYRCSPAQWMLVQNPPAIPTLLIAWVICFLRNSKLVIDWHNFGYSILALKLGSKHKFVSLSERYESAMSRLATANITVTDAMARVLKEQFHVGGIALHDRPASHFKPLSADDKKSFLRKLPETTQKTGSLELGSCRLLVSSTSWTADEDFGILLTALVNYSRRATSSPDLPELLAIITGKGPMKQRYLTEVGSLVKLGKLEKVTIKSAWLSMEDYASLLGAADLGVSLHTSASGVDLPMKVVDMFGAGLPVVGWSKFEAWPELVQEGVNGRGFQSSDELTELLVELFGRDGTQLANLREGALNECSRRWDDEWDPVAGKLLQLT